MSTSFVLLFTGQTSIWKASGYVYNVVFGTQSSKFVPTEISTTISKNLTGYTYSQRSR